MRVYSLVTASIFFDRIDEESIMTHRQRIHGDPRRDYAGEWRRWRKSRGWTQAEMAQVLWISRHTIVNIERGYHPPSCTSREKMAELQKRYREADLSNHAPATL